MELLQPHVLFHFKFLDGDDKALVTTYLKRDMTAYDDFKFWTPRFDKEWQILGKQFYNNSNVDGAGGAIIEKIYNMNCLLPIFL